MRNQQVFRSPEHHSCGLLVHAQPTLLDFLECLGHAAIVLDDRGTVLATNSHAERLLGGELGLRHGRLTAADRTSNDLLQDRMRQVLANPLFERALFRPVIVARRDQYPIAVQVIRAAGLVETVSENARAVVLLTDLSAQPGLVREQLKLLFGLTPAEARLAVRLCTGETMEDAADALHISLGTARNQLKAIFAKTETNRQAQLVALLSRISRIAADTSRVEP